MRHFDEHTLEEYVLGSLHADQHAIVSEHLQVCTKCQALALKCEDEAAQVKRVLSAARESRPGDCPSQEKLALYLDHGLDAVERVTIERHLAQCSECRVSLQAIRHDLALVRKMREEELAALERETITLPHTVLGQRRSHGTFRSVVLGLVRRYANVVLVASILGLGGWGPERFSPHCLVTAAIVAVSPVLRDRFWMTPRKVSLGRRAACSVAAIAFLAAWVVPSFSYWCLAIVLVGGATILIDVERAADSEFSEEIPEGGTGDAYTQKRNLD